LRAFKTRLLASDLFRDILSGVPKAGGSTIRQTTAPTPEPFGLAQLAGLGTLGLQVYNPFTSQFGALGKALGFPKAD
jgi:hypothetical protein